MLKNYLKTAWRNLLRNKFYSAINIAGLAIGLAVGIMMLLWVKNELSYDSFHRDADNIYKINSHIGSSSSAQVWEGAPAPLSVFCRQQIPEVVNVVRIYNIYDQFLFKYKDEKFIESNLAFVDSTFFSVFDFSLLEGNPDKPFPDLYSIVITASESKKYFGNEDPMGKILTTEHGNFTVSGIMEDFPENSSIRYDMLLPMGLHAELFTKGGGNGDWKTIDEDLGNYTYYIYLKIQKNASADVVGKKITRIFTQKKGADPSENFFTLQPLTTLHLVAADGNNSALKMVRIFLIIAILILLIACINYVNLSTARSMLRSKEVSMRKITGAAKLQLFFQFVVETALLFIFSVILAFGFIYLLMPLYNNISGKHLQFNLADKTIWEVIAVTILGTLAAASIYPALLLSSFKPIEALKGRFSLGIGNAAFRKVLVVMQFVFSIALIAGTIIISRQLQYVRSKALGYDRSHVLAFWMRDISRHYDAVRAELLKQPGVYGVSSAGSNIISLDQTTGDTDWDGKAADNSFMIHPMAIDQWFIPMMKLKLVAGNNFTGSESDSTHLILNETAVRLAGIKDPVGKTFSLWSTKCTIIGVVKDFNYASLKEKIEPQVFYYGSGSGMMYIKTTGRDAPKAIAAAQKLWKQYNPDFPFDYNFLDDSYDRLYRADQRMGTLFNIFSIIAILISCLGLFGLATYTAQLKTKEIGIRKVIGASVVSITTLLSKDFLKLVVISIIIATPVAWLAMNRWLQDFAYKINISWWIFLVAGLLAVLIALITVSLRAIKAAMANPVQALRSE